LARRRTLALAENPQLERPKKSIDKSTNQEIKKYMRHPSLPPGSRAPDFELPTQDGFRKSLDDFLTLGPLLLAFHRGTW
jgi:hypothetical protein